MSDTKHTPGPYRVDGKGWIVTEGDPYGHGRMHVADVRGWGHLTGGGACNFPPEKAAEIQDANARLIAAPPELLEALQTTLGNLNTIAATRPGITVYDSWRAMVAAAIEKATKP
jgi:hypothetical protein